MSEVDDATQQWLQTFIAAHDGVAGTVHRRAGHGDALQLCAAVNIPPKVQAITQSIPKGKGMAGLAWSRGVPVQTCNLRDDDTGDVRPGAKAVDARGAVAMPIFDGADEVVAVVGIAYADERVLDEAGLTALTEAAAQLPTR